MSSVLSPLITSITIKEQGQTLKSGDLLTLNVSITEESDISTCQIAFTNTTTGAKSLWFYRNSSVLQVGASNFQIGVPNGQVAYISMIYNSDNDCWYCDYNYWYYAIPGILAQTDLNTGTATASKTITAKLLRDNFYLKSETAGITNLGETDDFTITL